MEQNFHGQNPNLAFTASYPEMRLFEAISPSMRGVEAVLSELSHSTVPVLLIGERGTGKRTIARRIHLNSSRLHKEFRVLRCSGLDSDALATNSFREETTLYL